jgi:hypothetical protein
LLLNSPTRIAPRPRAPTAAVVTTAAVLLKNAALVELALVVVLVAKQGLIVQLRIKDNIIVKTVTKILGVLVWQCLFVCLC